MSNLNYSSFLNSVIQQLNDPNPEIVAMAKDALIEIGNNSPVNMASALVRALTSYSSTTNVNRAEIIKILQSITVKNFCTNLISATTYTILSLLTSDPLPDNEITEACLELLNTFCHMNSTIAAFEIRSISNNTPPIVEFFLARIREREMIFFISDNKPANPFTLLVNNLSKTGNEKVRSLFCQLLIELSDVLIDTKTDLKILTPVIFQCLDVIMNTWGKGVQSSIKSDFYTAVSSIVNAVDILQLNSRFDKIVSFFNEGLQISATKKAAAGGLPSVLSLIEKVRDKPKIQSTSSAKLLFDFIDSEYANIQMDGSIMRSINNAVGGLTALLNVYPKAPLDVVLNKIPQPASFYVLNYYCNLFGDRYAKEIATALSKVTLSAMNNDTKALFCNCFFTLIKKCCVSYEKQEIRKEEEKAAEEMRAKEAQSYNEYYVAPIVYVSQNETNSDSDNKFEVPKTIPILDDVLMKVAMFLGGDQNDQATRDAKLQFEFIMKQNPEAFRYIYPKIFAYLMTPSLFFSTPTLISVSNCGRGFIKKERKMLSESKIDEFGLITTLLMLGISDLFTASTKAEFRKVVSTIAGVDEQEENNGENVPIEEISENEAENEKTEKLIHEILSKHDNKEYHSSLLKAAQNNVNSYINYGGETPILSPTNRSALLSSNAKLLGYLLQSRFNNSELNSVLTTLNVQMTPLDSLRIAAIAKFIGITAAFNPENSVNFVKANMNMIISNQDNRLKFWKKKERPVLEPVSCTLSIGEILRYSPLTFNDFNILVGNFNTRFIESKEVPNWAKMRTIEAIVNRNTSDPKFSVSNIKSYSTRASIVIQESVDPGTFISAIDALYAICVNNVNNIERPEIVLGNMLKFTDKSFKPNENVDCILHLSSFIQKIVSSKQMTNSTIILNFHEAISKFLTTSIWPKFVESMEVVVSSFNSIAEPNKLKFMQLIATYYIISTAKNSETAKKIVFKLLTLLDSSKFDSSLEISTPAQMAQIIIDNSGSEINETLNSLFTTITTLSHSQLGSSANALLRSFSTTKQASEDPQTFAKEYIKHSNESGDAIVTLFNIDKTKIINLLLTEQFTQNISTTVSSLFSSNEIRYDIIFTLIEQAKLLSKENLETNRNETNQSFISPIETAMNILSSLKYSIPYYSNECIGEYILIELSIINLKLKFQLSENNKEALKDFNEKQIALLNASNLNITKSICDVFGAVMGDNSIFNGDKNKERKRMISPQESPQVIRLVFQDFISKKKGESKPLFETVKKLKDLNDYVSQIIISIALGQILSNKSTSADLCIEIVDFLTDGICDESENNYLDENSQIKVFNRIIALSEIYAYSESVKKCNAKIIDFVFKYFKYAPGPGLNAILRVLPSLDEENSVKYFDEILKVVEQALCSKLISNLTNSNVNALKILMIICSSTALSKVGSAIEKLWIDYPLFLGTMYFCPDLSISSKCLDLFNNRLGLPRMTISFNFSITEDCFKEFIRNNQTEIQKMVAINPQRFVDNLIQKVAEHSCQDVRSLFTIFAVFLISLQGEEVIKENEKSKLKKKIDEMFNDQSEKVRIILASSLQNQLQ